jgi:hypothetical protein
MKTEQLRNIHIMVRKKILTTLGLLGLGALLGLTAIAIEINSNASDETKAVKADGGCGSACCALPSNKQLLATP